jgi:hypothetical protein
MYKSPVPPDSETTLEFDVHAPERVGTYNFQCRMLKCQGAVAPSSSPGAAGFMGRVAPFHRWLCEWPLLFQNARAVAFPMPEVPPVMRTILFSKVFIVDDVLFIFPSVCSNLGSKRKRRTNGERGDGFHEPSCFRCVSLSGPRAYWARCLLGPLALPVPMLVLDIELLKINHFRPRTTSPAACLW